MMPTSESTKKRRIDLYSRLRQAICPFREIATFMPSKGRILDVGSGYGTFERLVASNSQLEIWGLEIDPNKLTKARRLSSNLRNVKFVLGDIVDFESSLQFDVITCIDIFHHIPRHRFKSALRNLHRLLKNGGLMLVKEVDTSPVTKYLWNYFHDVLVNRALRPNYISKSRMINLLEQNGFAIELSKDVHNSLYAHYLIVCKKVD